MQHIYLGKFSNKYPEQIQGKFYAAGSEGSIYYGDVKVGDYVFAAYEGKIIGAIQVDLESHIITTTNQLSDYLQIYLFSNS